MLARFQGSGYESRLDDSSVSSEASPMQPERVALIITNMMSQGFHRMVSAGPQPIEIIA